MTLIGKSFECIVDIHDLDTVSRALNAAEEEIHHPGYARANNFDLIDLIDQARQIVLRAATKPAA